MVTFLSEIQTEINWLKRFHMIKKMHADTQQYMLSIDHYMCFKNIP